MKTRYKGILISYYPKLEVYQASYEGELIHSECLGDMLFLLNCRIYCRYTV